jgi:hypothetical protein
MLNFLGFAPQAQVLQTRPRSFRMFLELVNVAARGEEVKCLFVKGGRVGTGVRKVDASPGMQNPR